MSKILSISILLIISFLTLGNSNEIKSVNETEYKKNLYTATELYLSKKIIPLNILKGLVPNDNSEFELYYATTYPDQKLSETDFFYDTTRLIFEQVTFKKNDDFYLPSLKLISFADGEYAEEFIEYLELIIKMDNKKFCESIIGKEYANHNPIKYYSDLNKCE